MEQDKKENRITVRMTKKQLFMLNEIKAKALPYQSRSEIVRTILAVVHERLPKENI